MPVATLKSAKSLALMVATPVDSASESRIALPKTLPGGEFGLAVTLAWIVWSSRQVRIVCVQSHVAGSFAGELEVIASGDNRSPSPSRGIAVQPKGR